MRSRVCLLLALLLASPVLVSPVFVSPSFAGDVQGKVTDRSGGVLSGAVVRLLNVASGEERSAVADANGRYQFAALPPGTYRLAAAFRGFSESSRTIVVLDASAVSADFVLELGTLKMDDVTVAARGTRDTQTIPLRADALSADMLRQLVPPSTGDALISVPSVTPVGSGPFQIRPRLRGLDSTRVLVLVDGERLNNARTATDRAGIEVGLVDANAIQSVEVLGGAGSVLYGTDALAGTINIITNRPRLTSTRQLVMGFNGMYSSNEHGQRGMVTLGASSRRIAVTFMGGAERFDDYRAGRDFAESSQRFLDAGRLRQADTIDSNFPPFSFRAFPDPFNAPFTRTSAVVPRSTSDGSSVNLAAVALVTPSQELQIRYQRRHATDVGFPDFEPPFFFQTITLPFSRFEKFSATYSMSMAQVASWLPKLTARVYAQRHDRLLRNDFPVQFPAPTPQAFFPISVFRLNIVSETRQQVWTPGVELQANVLARPNNVLTAGLSIFRDRSEDERTTTTTTTLVGRVALGQFGPAATVLPAPVVLGPPSIDHPVRVPNASFRDIGVFVQDEWDLTPVLRLVGGLRVDGYRVTTDPTPGYSVASLVTGATPAIDPATLPNIDGDHLSRTAVTGEAGFVLGSGRPVSLFGHYVRSYRHPNLEELLFSGPATAGNIMPNVKVEPETGHNVDVGTRFRLRRVTGSAAYFNNTYHGFISTEAVSSSPAGSISQAINLAAVRIHGIEGQADAPFAAGGWIWSPYTTFAWTRGTVLSGTSPLTEASLAGAPQDNITPIKFAGGLRVSDRGERWWAAYGVRAQGTVTRVSPLLSGSPFLIAQDLLSLDGFAVHRVAAGYDWRKGHQHLGLTLAIDNLTDAFYREHFQFAPARGRSVSVAVHVRGIR